MNGMVILFAAFGTIIPIIVLGVVFQILWYDNHAMRQQTRLSQLGITDKKS
jgi:hypothetical protein